MFRIFHDLKDFFRSRRLAYALSAVTLLLDYAIQLVMPWLVGYLTDLLASGGLTRENFARSMILLFVAIVVSYGVSFYWNYQVYHSANVIVRDMRSRMLDKFLVQTPFFYRRFSKATLLTRTIDDVNALDTFTGYAMMCLADSTIYPLSVIIFMGVTINWPLTLLAVIPILLILPIYTLLAKKIYRLYDEQQESYEVLYEQVLENISAVRLTRAYRMELQVEAQFQEAVDDTYKKTMEVSRLDAVFGPINRIFSALALVTALIGGGILLARGEVSLGNMVSFNIYLGFLVWPMLAFGDFVNFTQQATASMERILELLDYREEALTVEHPVPYAGDGGIEAVQYSFRYPGTEEEALTGLNFCLGPGETLGIVGKTGSGKSTLVRQLLNLYPQSLLTTGSLKVSGQAVDTWTPDSLRDAVGYVPQDHMLFSDTIAENVRFGKPDATEDEIREALAFADLSKDLAQLEDGAQTVVGEKGVTLSGGQKQRLAIARAVIRDPEILILDDSLSAVDAQTEQRILEHIRNERSGRTTVITAHRLSAVQHADLILVLDGGKIVDQGTHDELMARGGWYCQQYIHQLEGKEVKDGTCGEA